MSHCIVLNTESSFVQVSCFLGVAEDVGGIRYVMKGVFFVHFLLIYLDELIKLVLSCNKRLLSEWTYSMKASDAKRWNRGTCEPAFLSSLFISLVFLASVCQYVWLFRCDVSVVFSQTQAVTLWTAAACNSMVFHCCVPQVILNLQLGLFKSFSWDVCFKECVNS